jgi:hypothetical protein
MADQFSFPVCLIYANFVSLDESNVTGVTKFENSVQHPFFPRASSVRRKGP